LQRFNIENIKIPVWVNSSEKENFSEHIYNVQADFFDLWNHKGRICGKPANNIALKIIQKYQNKIIQNSKQHVEHYLMWRHKRRVYLDSKGNIELEIIKKLKLLENDFYISKAEIAKKMIDVYDMIEECLAPPVVRDWTKCNADYLEKLSSRLEARGTERVLNKQILKIGDSKPEASNKYSIRKRKFEIEDRYAALLIWLVLDHYDQEPPITSHIFKKIDAGILKKKIDQEAKPPAKWSQFVKLSYRKINYISKDSDLGLLQFFQKEWNKRNSNQILEVSDSEYEMLGMACVFEIEKTLKDFLEQKKELKDKFSAERWLHLKHGSRKWKVAD
jgi:hypothetical protein